MTDVPSTRRVEITFVGRPPVSRIKRASGVAGVTFDGFVLSCAVHGSFQSLLEALRGHEVMTFTSTPLPSSEIHGGQS